MLSTGNSLKQESTIWLALGKKVDVEGCRLLGGS